MRIQHIRGKTHKYKIPSCGISQIDALEAGKSFCQYSCLLDKWLFNGTAYCTAQGRCHDVRKVWIHQLNLLSQYVDEMYLYQCENYHRMKQKNITPVVLVLGRRECFYP